jgi:hypothetical protein
MRATAQLRTAYSRAAPATAVRVLHQHELFGQVREHRLKRALDPSRPGAARIPRVARFAPRRELRRDRLLHRLAIREERRAAGTGA